MPSWNYPGGMIQLKEFHARESILLFQVMTMIAISCFMAAFGSSGKLMNGVEKSSTRYFFEQGTTINYYANFLPLLMYIVILICGIRPQQSMTAKWYFLQK